MQAAKTVKTSIPRFVRRAKRNDYVVGACTPGTTQPASASAEQVEAINENESSSQIKRFARTGLCSRVNQIIPVAR